MAQGGKHKTDLGTIIMHWILVITLTVSVATGLRIAMDSPDQAWLVALDNYLPLYTVWTRHIPAAVTLVAISLAYALYIYSRVSLSLLNPKPESLRFAWLLA